MTSQYLVEQSHATTAQRLRRRHVVADDTIETLRRQKNGSTMRQLAVDLGYLENFATTLSHVIKQTPGCITLAGENLLRHRLGLSPLSEMRLVRVCPSCGEIHGAGIDCHGQPITVIALASGEHIAKDGQKRKPSGKSAWTPDLQRWRKRLGVTIREVIEAGLFAIEEEQEEHP